MHIILKNPRLVNKINTVAFRKKIKIKDPSEKNAHNSTVWKHLASVYHLKHRFLIYSSI